MAAIAAVAIVAFIAFLINARIRSAGVSDRPDGLEQSDVQWYEFILAGIVLIIAAAGLIWSFTPDTDQLQPAGDRRPLLFLAAMIAVGGISFLVFIIALFTGFRPGPRDLGREASRTQAATIEAETVPATYPASHAARLLGLLFLLVAYLILNWTALDPGRQYFLMSTLIYPATITIALVMLFDKITRGRSIKAGAESFREWIFCDAIVFLLVLSLLNLHQLEAAAETYRALFWDVVQVALCLFLFWLIDRTRARLRFLVGYIYITGLPVLLLIWRSVQELPMPGADSWWETAWPFFFLAIFFFVLELISVIATRDDGKHGVGAVKDTVFVVVYGALLLIAIPAQATPV